VPARPDRDDARAALSILLGSVTGLSG
jgi:hypothetical protein